MKCIHCQGRMKEGSAALHIDRDECHVTLDRIPAWICDQCGESYFEEDAVSAVQDVIKFVEDKGQALRLSA